MTPDVTGAGVARWLSRSLVLGRGISQMAVSQNTVAVCPVAVAVAVGGAEYGGGCFLFQLGRMGMLSCLHRFFSGRWRALISRHKIRFFSIISIILVSPQSHGIWNATQTQTCTNCRSTVAVTSGLWVCFCVVVLWS